MLRVRRERHVEGGVRRSTNREVSDGSVVGGRRPWGPELMAGMFDPLVCNCAVQLEKAPRGCAAQIWSCHFLQFGLR